ncbi:unnamed protein product [Polarella glacialis]|uniref:Uncharacterized protein n=1 Tax=Polarella glacialis TaxID=89957 RepID=A0A813LWM0_POLGL|nr:unnamed protein product [Polarella glacialis]
MVTAEASSFLVAKGWGADLFNIPIASNSSSSSNPTTAITTAADRQQQQQQQPLQPQQQPQEQTRPGFGRKIDSVRTIASMISHFASSSKDAAPKMLSMVVKRLDALYPGLQHEFSNKSAKESVLLLDLGKLRQDAMEQGFQSIAIKDLDFLVSKHGQMTRQTLNANGYRVGKRAWSSMSPQDEDPHTPSAKKTRRLSEFTSRGGRPRKLDDQALIDLTRDILQKYAKPGSKPAVVTVSNTGYASAGGRTSANDKSIVPSFSLLAAPGSIWADNPDLQKEICLPSFRRLLQQSFAEFRPGHRRTDICTHCDCFWKELIPNFRRDWKKAQHDLKGIYPDYFREYPEQFADVVAEAAAAWEFVASHSIKNKLARRAALSQGDQLQLYTFTEAPAQVLLEGRKNLLTAYAWRMLAARRQQAVCKKLMSPTGLLLGDTLVIFDWREKIRLPVGPDESGAMWHAQQKLAISCWGCVVIRHSPTSTAEKPELLQTNVLYIPDSGEQTAMAANFVLDQLLSDVDIHKTGVLHIWSDCGPHFRSAENLRHRCINLCKVRRQIVVVNFLAEQHAKNILDGIFGTTGLKKGWLGQYARTHNIFNIPVPQLI